MNALAKRDCFSVNFGFGFAFRPLFFPPMAISYHSFSKNSFQSAMSGYRA